MLKKGNLERIKLESTLGQFAVGNAYILLVFGAVLVIYHICVLYIERLVPSVIFTIYLYFAFLRKIFRFKKVEFNSQHVYVGGIEYSYLDIITINENKIVIRKDNERKAVYFNFFFCPNIQLLKDYHNQKKIPILVKQ